MRLHNLSNVKGATHRRKRVGCGEGNGHGKTCGRGGKGQTARSGGGIRIGFEGGQMPIFRKLPIRGFNNKNFRTDYESVNVGELSKLDDSVTEVDREALAVAGLVRLNDKPLKILGEGEITKALKVKAVKFSASAKEKIEKAGGEAIVSEA
ncbi:50S ribosomal protein L15 [Pelagicoccus sp. NFK12]|uniref:Large ribosomal subunit protein uL15 n=1 Tax=Pelagicoccus enzymogenes TaxID=2773457 RepID=A0A927FF40_9BACT|nr:50S ribosomal protein L15 [Pelagicoccus enzymogenes]MBD5782540.1 50S ribosomal protein L15 [Pelagicoccus enzymogenes]MDQ8199546.1 50S ribosomal protein L15 [Pelagicoccus enzymogenes]